MKAIAYLLGYGYLSIGTVLVLYTRETVVALQKLARALPLKYLSAIPAIFGLLFFISASATAFPWFMRVIGLLAVCKALVIFTNPRNLYGRLLDWYFQKVTEQTQRLFGIISIILGTAILTWIR